MILTLRFSSLFYTSVSHPLIKLTSISAQHRDKRKFFASVHSQELPRVMSKAAWYGTNSIIPIIVRIIAKSHQCLTDK